MPNYIIGDPPPAPAPVSVDLRADGDGNIDLLINGICVAFLDGAGILQINAPLNGAAKEVLTRAGIQLDEDKGCIETEF